MAEPLVTSDQEGRPTHEAKCWRCRKVLMLASSGSGIVETKCPRCHAINRVTLTTSG